METEEPVLAESPSAPALGPTGAGSLVAGRFRLDDLLTEDAGARLWRATDLTLARSVAVHVVPAEDPRSGAALTAARTSATVSDGRILRVLDALREGDHVSIVHEWGSGLSLDRLVADEPLAARRAAWLVREVAEAIAVAHRHGVAHGRLLPENVMVNDAGAVKLAGFVVDGVLRGRTRASSGEDGHKPAVPPLSDHEADVRNLGALLYAAVTGRWPGSPDSVLPPAPAAERGLVCRPRQVRPGVPRGLDLLCDQVLNQGGGRTFESAAEVSQALSAWLGEPVAGTAVTSATLPGDDDLHPWDVDPDPDATVVVPRPAGTAGTADPEATQQWQPPARAATGEGLDGASSRATDDRTHAAVDLPTGDPGEPGRAGQPGPVRGGGTRPVVPLTQAPPRPDVPPHWGPDRPGDPPALVRDTPSRGVPWLRLAAVLAALTLAVLAVVVALDLGSTPSDPPQDDPSAGTSRTPAAPARPVPVTVTSFDPDDQSGGPPEENPDLVPLTTDGDPATVWTTETYEGGPPLAPYKRGLGLLLDLGRPTEVASVDVTLVGGDHDLTLFAAPGDAAAAPTDVVGLTRVAREVGVQGRVRTVPATAGTGDPVATRWLVVWLTALPVSGSGFQGQVGEVVVRS